MCPICGRVVDLLFMPFGIGWNNFEKENNLKVIANKLVSNRHSSTLYHLGFDFCKIKKGLGPNFCNSEIYSNCVSKEIETSANLMCHENFM